MLGAKVVLPDEEHFPDPYDKTPEAAERLFRRVCGYMRVERSRIDFEIFPDETDELREILPYWHGGSGGCAGLYTHEPASDSDGDNDELRMAVAVRSTQLQDPLSLVATMAHELGHVILLGGKLIDAETADHEPLTDLLTVFLGFGVFNANSAGRFRQYQNERRQGWSMQRLGYLSQEIYGYALAEFARERGERKPEWVKHLATNVRAYYKRSRAWLEKNARPKAIG